MIFIYYLYWMKIKGVKKTNQFTVFWITFLSVIDYEWKFDTMCTGSSKLPLFEHFLLRVIVFNSHPRFQIKLQFLTYHQKHPLELPFRWESKMVTLRKNVKQRKFAIYPVHVVSNFHSFSSKTKKVIQKTVNRLVFFTPFM